VGSDGNQLSTGWAWVSYRRLYPGPMPFTVSHVAAVLPAGRFPLLRVPLITSAFIVGAMSPDASYFVPLSSWIPIYAWSYHGHTWQGLLWLDIPITLAIVAVYWTVLAAPMRALAPRGVRARLPRNVLQQHRGALLQTAALLFFAAGFGAATHIVWDAFTHEGRFGVMAVPLLQLPHVFGPLPAYRVLQYVSSLVGLALVTWTVVRWYRRTPTSAVVAPGLGWRWQVVFAASLATAGALAWWSVRDLAFGANDLYDVRELLYGGLTRSIAFMALVAVVGSLMAQPALARAEAAAPT
jgi:hypothetical protein